MEYVKYFMENVFFSVKYQDYYGIHENSKLFYLICYGFHEKYQEFYEK